LLKQFLIAAALIGSGWSLGATADSQASPMRPAPALSVDLLNGGKTDLEKLRGRVVLVNYWASWCPPCLMEMPSMNRLAKNMAGKPFVMLAVNAGESAESVRRFSTVSRPSFLVGLDPGNTHMRAWGAIVLPTSYLVDKSGNLRRVLVGPVNWNSPEILETISGLLAEPARAEVRSTSLGTGLGPALSPRTNRPAYLPTNHPAAI